VKSHAHDVSRTGALEPLVASDVLTEIYGGDDTLEQTFSYELLIDDCGFDLDVVEREVDVTTMALGEESSWSYP
jgi:hypothetical protein